MKRLIHLSIIAKCIGLFFLCSFNPNYKKGEIFMDITKERQAEASIVKVNYFEKVKFKKISVFTALILIMIAAVLISICTGRYAIPVDQLWTILIGKIFGLQKTWPDTLETVLINVRIPRIIIALVVGAALSTAGSTYQGLFKNPMISITKYVADPESKLPAITFWLMGGLNTSTWRNVVVLLVPVIIASIPLFLVRYKINVLSFGEEEAKALGVDTTKTRFLIIMCSTLLTTAAVSVSGMVGWVGLIIPHVARMIVGPNYKVLLPASFIIGGTYLLLIDDFARSLFITEIPLGILTALIGAPFFLFLLIKQRGRSQL